MVTGQPLLINWGIHPSISARRKISLLSWIVSTETDPKTGGKYPLGTSPWFCTSRQRLLVSQLKRPFFEAFDLQDPGKRRSEIYSWQNRNIRHQTGQRCPCTHLPAFIPRISWSYRAQSVWPQWLYQAWPRLWIDSSGLTGTSVRSEHCATIRTGPQTSGRIRSWSLSPSRKVLTRTSHLPLSLLGSSRL